MSQPQPNTEHIKFRIGISGTYWDKKPQYMLWLDDKLIANDYITASSGEVQYIEFSEHLAEEQQHQIRIRLNNKDDKDVIQNAECTEILKDMLLNIVSIEIDDIDVEQLIYGASKYIPDDPKWPPITECINLGWTGDYIFTFESPVYLWLLENM